VLVDRILAGLALLMVELAITPDRRWRVSAPELAALAAVEGFVALGIAAGSADVEAFAAYERAGVRCHEVLSVVVNEDAEETLENAAQAAVAAEIMRAEWVLTVFRTPLNTDSSRTVARCAAIYGEAGAGMAVEFSPFGPVTSIPAALEVVDAARRGGRAGVMIDSWHFSFGGSTWDDLMHVPLERIAYVQFADALPLEGGDLFAETIDRRALPGEGVLELRRFASTLLERGYDGIVSVEVLNRELGQLPAENIVHRISETSRRYWP
jgi:sugar phosphate isomerase/epimerase